MAVGAYTQELADESRLRNPKKHAHNASTTENGVVCTLLTMLCRPRGLIVCRAHGFINSMSAPHLQCHAFLFPPYYCERHGIEVSMVTSPALTEGDSCMVRGSLPGEALATVSSANRATECQSAAAWRSCAFNGCLERGLVALLFPIMPSPHSNLVLSPNHQRHAVLSGKHNVKLITNFTITHLVIKTPSLKSVNMTLLGVSIHAAEPNAKCFPCSLWLDLTLSTNGDDVYWSGTDPRESVRTLTSTPT
ncbi:unnamed protein product [Pleuronectes platessa]|uniref:Uncharacterized protein n=1 Tax=Pleuronectes platessa TaxID=8262 RepID=A0A9N7UQD9_PLEPL|nr:unnamed protein product [Pleuronectes platessa]